MAGLVGLDFETYGAVDLNTHGLARYVGDKSFMPLIGSVTCEDTRAVRGVERLDFVSKRKESTNILRELIGGSQIVAHNVPFEYSVLNWLGLDYPASRFIDSAVVSRAVGGGGKLEEAAPQLLGHSKMPDGKRLIRLFSVPGKYQEENGNDLFDERVIADNIDDWLLFGEYCDSDSGLGLDLAHGYLSWLTQREMDYAAITLQMNMRGWSVDVPLVEEMQRRYLENMEVALAEFRVRNNAPDLNLNSFKQQKEWCLERGVKARSFDKDMVEKLIPRIEKKLDTLPLDDPKGVGYAEVLEFLKTKQVLGGSSLKKLATILDTVVEDTWNPGGHRLMDQYFHCGAGQTWRTTGRGVQMQNLKRLGSDVADMDELFDDGDDPVDWDNTKLAENLRQVFTSRQVDGRLIVGDLKSVESCGLAYLAGEDWKLRAYREGRGVYEELAARMFGISYSAVHKDSVERRMGKVGELSCGYQAGAVAVKDFAAKMGHELSEAEAAKVVYDWRDSCPRTTEFWTELDNMLHCVVENGSICERLVLPYDGLMLEVSSCLTPSSLIAQHRKAQSIQVSIRTKTGEFILKRYFHGCYMRGGNIGYYKPSTLKSGDLWKNNYVDPKTKQLRFYELYGGKLAGILTQSFCRELFMVALAKTSRWCDITHGQVQLIGQFHDEIVLDWVPGAVGLGAAELRLNSMMSQPDLAPSFPLGADIKSAYRYIK